MRKLIYIIFFYSSLCISQISITLKIIGKNSGPNNGRRLEIRIKNETEVSYALPIDTVDFKPFYQDESCTDFSEPDNLMLANNFENERGETSMAIPGFTLLGTIDENDKKVIKEMQRRKSRVELQQRETKLWKKKNKIGKSVIWAAKNKFLYSNILILKPKQEIIYYKIFSPEKFNLDSITGNYNYYNFNLNEYYLFSLNYCVDYKIYQYLTQKQKDKLSGYQLFSGYLRSNVLRWD